MRAFQCTGCGACCRLVYSNQWFREHGFLRSDGACKHLAADNSCSIYDTRPDICRINGVYEKAGLVNIVPVEMWHDYVIETSCHGAILKTGTDPAKLPTRNYDRGLLVRRVTEYCASIGAGQSFLSLDPSGWFPPAAPPFLVSQNPGLERPAQTAETRPVMGGTFRVPE